MAWVHAIRALALYLAEVMAEVWEEALAGDLAGFAHGAGFPPKADPPLEEMAKMAQATKINQNKSAL